MGVGAEEEAGSPPKGGPGLRQFSDWGWGWRADPEGADCPMPSVLP